MTMCDGVVEIQRVDVTIIVLGQPGTMNSKNLAKGWNHHDDVTGISERQNFAAEYPKKTR
jgi:hypothetical protein